MPNELRGSLRPRPLRIAFLIQDCEHAHLILDGIFADCYSRWGGRFSLIVPCTEGRIPTEMAAFKEFASKRATSLSIISALFAPKLDIRTHPWSGAFNLVIGNSLADRILFWNARLLIPAWLDHDICCFRVDMDQLRNPEFLAILGDLLNYRNHVNAGAGGQSQTTIRSTSLTNDQLAEAQQLIQGTGPWGMIMTEAVAGLDAVLPDPASLQSAREGNRFGSDFFSRPDWTSFIWFPPFARPPVLAPDHLSDAPIRQTFTQGYWCTDFAFEYDGPGPRLMEDNQWVLPHRWRMAGAFNTTWISAPRHALPPQARRSRGGNLAIFLCNDCPIESIRIPTAYEAIQYAVAADGRWAKLDAEHEQVHPLHRVIWTEPSNEARYLTGILGMTSGLSMAKEFLLNPFLREMFAKLGGTPNLTKKDMTPTVNRLQKEARRQPAFDLKNENERQALANLIVKAARGLKDPMTFVRYDLLKEQWKEHRKAYWEANPQQNQQNADVD